MTITPEELAAFVDGELEGEEEARIAAAIEADPELARQAKAHRELAARLYGHFAPILDQPVPDRLSRLLASGGEGEPDPRAEVIEFSAARDRLEAKRRLPNWSWGGGAIAAALIAALLLSSDRGGAPGEYADVRLASVLDEQLAASGPVDGDTRILLSFRNEAGEFCRAFADEGSSGIACRDDKGWRQQVISASDKISQTDFRMAGSEAEVLEIAQDLAAGPALSNEEEEAARSAGWVE